MRGRLAARSPRFAGSLRNVLPPTAAEAAAGEQVEPARTSGPAARSSRDRACTETLVRGPYESLTSEENARLGDIAELLGLRERLQLLERLVLDLADALARDVERPPDLVERARMLAAQPVAQLE